MNFQDNPNALFTQLEVAWGIYTSEFEKHIRQALSSIVSWQWANDDMFRSHPLFGQADTSHRADSWSPFTRSWLADDDEKSNLVDGWKHGLDEQGRIVLAYWDAYGYVTLWRNDGFDRLQVYNSTEAATGFLWSSQNRHQPQTQFTRYWINRDGLIDCICRCFEEFGTHYRKFEWFEYQNKRCVSSIQQSFCIMPKIPDYQKDESDAKLRLAYRPVDGIEMVEKLVETMIWRRQVKYSYGTSGELIKAEVFGSSGEPVAPLLFKRRPARPLEKTIDELAAKTSQTIFKAVKKRSPDKPYRGLALVYSAEHPHCGLPHTVYLLGKDSERPTNRYNFEEFPLELEVTFKRPVLNLLTEFNQRCHALFTEESFDGEVEAAVSVVEKIAKQLGAKLIGTKHVLVDFSIVVVDDHGDVDGFSVPT